MLPKSIMAMRLAPLALASAMAACLGPPAPQPEVPARPWPAGELTTWGDARFAARVGAAGHSEPGGALAQAAAGLFLLEPFDPRRETVVFVHGAGATPASGRRLLERLDRRRFQIWVLAYPSGERLPATAARFDHALASLRAKFSCPRVWLVGHSLGGLLASRVATLHNARQPGSVAGLVTLATPWGPHPVAALGAGSGAVDVPAFADLGPQSPFLAAVAGRAPGCPHLLVCTTRSRSRPLLPAANDGSVSVASQLLPAVAGRASRILRVHHGHLEVLGDPAVAAAVADFLAKPET
jgi:pimeloyl-ACP methyl ester carboxylesterase